jgi:hypothetical protein
MVAGKRLSEPEEVRFGGVAVLVMAGVSTLEQPRQANA